MRYGCGGIDRNTRRQCPGDRIGRVNFAIDADQPIEVQNA
jgi:hypothetical protein